MIYPTQCCGDFIAKYLFFFRKLQMTTLLQILKVLISKRANTIFSTSVSDLYVLKYFFKPNLFFLTK